MFDVLLKEIKKNPVTLVLLLMFLSSMGVSVPIFNDVYTSVDSNKSVINDSDIRLYRIESQLRKLELRLYQMELRDESLTKEQRDFIWEKIENIRYEMER